LDPLFEYKAFKDTCVNADDLIKKIENFRSMPDAVYESQYEEAQKYLSSYFAAVTDEKMAKFVT
jgi:hypothetical protein